MPPRVSPRWALASLCLTTLLPTLSTSIANIALPNLAQYFQAPFQAVQWVVLAYLLGITCLIVGIGRLGDLWGRKKVLLLGIGLYGAASVLCALAPTLGALIAARAVQGIGAATMLALGMAFVRDVLPPEQTGRAMGLLGTTSAIGTALGPSLGGLVIDQWGWRWVFALLIPLTVLNMAMVWRFLPRAALAHAPGRYDIQGTLTLALTLAAFALAMTQRQLTPALLLLGVAAGGVSLFVRGQSRSASPLIPLGVFAQVGFKPSLCMSGLISTVMMSTLIVGPFLFSIGLGLSTSMTGLLMATGPVMASISGVPAGRLIDRYGAPRCLNIGLLVMLLGGIGLSALPQRYGAAGYMLSVAILTPGYQLFLAANNTSVMSSVPPEQRGLISAILNLSRYLGLITSASLMASVFALATGTPQITSASATAVQHGASLTFAVSSALIGVAWLIAMLKKFT